MTPNPMSPNPMSPGRMPKSDGAPDNLRRTALYAGAAACVMLGVAFAAKPLYDTFCRVTGFGGTTRRADVGAERVVAAPITIRFDANQARGLPLDFKPLQTEQVVNPGANGLAFYEVTNTSSAPITVVATYNVTPHKAGPYFNKLECFCFTDTTFAPGETMELPVVYYVHPDITEERHVADVREITLAYTFFESSKQAPPAAGGLVAVPPAANWQADGPTTGR